MGGWLEKVKIKLISTQVVVEVEVRVELGKKNMQNQKKLTELYLGLTFGTHWV